MRKRFYILFVARGEDGQLRKIPIPVHYLYVLVVGAAIGALLEDFKFVPALSHAAAADNWDGETGLVHEVVLRHLRSENMTGPIDAYACGPTPMIDAVLPILQVNGVEPDHIYFDKFTPAVR